MKITVNSTTLQNWKYGGTTAKLRFYANRQFATDDGVIVMKGSVTGGSWYKEVDCTIASGNVLTIPAIILDSTVDSDQPLANYTAVFFDEKNLKRDVFFLKLRVPTALGTPVAWTALRTFNNIAPLPLSPLYPTIEQVAQLFKNSTGIAQYANLAQFPPIGSLTSLYIAQQTNILYRYTGTEYVSISGGSVREFATFAGFPFAGVLGFLYVALDTNTLYRYTGNGYVALTGGGASIPVAAPAPTNPVTDNIADTFNWTYPAGISTGDIEYTTDGGISSAPTNDKPIGIGNGAYPKGIIGVRVKANATRLASAWLFNEAPFTATNAADTTAPTIGVMNAPVVVSTSRIDLSWTAASDLVGVTGYEITRSLTSAYTSFITVNVSNALAYINSGLTPGTTYFYKHRAFDAAGNYSAYSNGVSATTIAVAPTPTNPVTNDTANTFDWSYPAGGYVLADIEYTSDGGATAIKPLQQPVYVGTLAHGVDRIGVRIKATAARLASAWLFNKVPFEPEDTTPPTINITAPAANATLSGATNPFTVEAADIVGVRGVKFYIDNVLIGTEDTTSPYSVNIDATTLSAGAHTLKAIGYDISGNASTEALRTITVAAAASNQNCVKVRVCPRAAAESRMNGMLVQGADAIGGPWTTLATLTTPAPNPAYTDFPFTNTTSFKYLRIFAFAGGGPTFNDGDVAEVIFLAANDAAIARAGIIGANEFSAEYDAAKAFDGNTATAYATVGGVDSYVGIEVQGAATSAFAISEPTALPSGVNNDAYIRNIATTGGVNPHTSVTRTAGTLPTGLNPNISSGVARLSGIVSGTGTYSFTLKITDSSTPAMTASKDFTLTIGVTPIAPESFSISEPSPLPPATNGAEYTRTIATMNGTLPHKATAIIEGALPAGLTPTIVSGAAQISGRPSVSGTFKFKLSVTDQNNVAPFKDFTLTVGEAFAPSADLLLFGGDFVTFNGNNLVY